jgi:hypothetical protein
MSMSPATKDLLERVKTWPLQDQEELVAAAREIESRRMAAYGLLEDEQRAVRAGFEDARRGNSVSDEEMEEFYQLHRRA